LSSKSYQIDKGSKMSCNIWLNFNRGINSMLGNYSGPWFGKKKVMTVQRTKTATIQRQPKQIIEYDHRTTIDHIMILWWSGRSVLWLNLGNWTFSMTVVNFS